MPSSDADRWNLRYLDDPKASFEQPRELLISHLNIIPKNGLALDLAMGLGGNAKFLLSQGLRVVGVDISSVAVIRAKNSAPGLMTVIADLNSFYIPPDTFDIILNFLYVQRDLWEPIVRGLKMEGILFIECLTEKICDLHPEVNSDYLLKPGELSNIFSTSQISRHMEILYSFDGWRSTGTSRPRPLADLIARRIA